jgi:antitoxin component of MazEF toxin-antitoxin module
VGSYCPNSTKVPLPGQGDFFPKVDYNRGMIRKIFKTGHSLAITLSQNLLKGLNLKPGDSVRVEQENDKIIISKSKGKQQLDLGFKIRPKL